MLKELEIFFFRIEFNHIYIYIRSLDESNPKRDFSFVNINTASNRSSRSPFFFFFPLSRYARYTYN